jgi:hypothetical protein
MRPRLLCLSLAATRRRRCPCNIRLHLLRQQATPAVEFPLTAGGAPLSERQRRRCRDLDGLCGRSLNDLDNDPVGGRGRDGFASGSLGVEISTGPSLMALRSRLRPRRRRAEAATSTSPSPLLDCAPTPPRTTTARSTLNDARTPVAPRAADAGLSRSCM